VQARGVPNQAGVQVVKTAAPVDLASRSAGEAPAASRDARKLLVVTPREETWGTDEPLVFLGPWCKLPEKRHVWDARHHETVPFHWDDPETLKRDYDYLQALHHDLLRHLAAALNRLHQRECSVRYWQILLDPWLLTYLAVMFDRWECLRFAFEQYPDLEMRGSRDDAATLPPFSYGEFIRQVVSDEWNRSICCRIVAGAYSDNYCIHRNACDIPRGSSGAGVASERQFSLPARFFRAADRFVGRLVVRYDVVFIKSYFDAQSLFRLNLALGQVPRLFLEEFNWPSDRADSAPAGADRAELNIEWKPRSSFELFLSRSLVGDLPGCVVESYRQLCERAERVPIKTKTIVTANAHWYDTSAKFWCAEQIERGVKLVILEHGGSFPAYKELFDFEEDIADVKGTWFEPYHPKHVKVPPSKLVRRMNGRLPSFRSSPEREYCAIIENAYPRWVYRAHFRSMAAQTLEVPALIGRWYAALDDLVRASVRLKPYPPADSVYWNTRELYKEMLGEGNVLAEPRIERVFELSRVIVCTAPETVFSEAMISGLPTILIYPARFFARHPVADSLLDTLRAANVVFHDPLSAAAHINAIWAEPGLWWSQSDVMKARQAFQRQALYVGDDWLKEWTAFLNNVLAG